MRLTICLLMIVLFLSCNNEPSRPDVSNISVNLVTRRFEKELFLIDSTQRTPALDKLIGSYPSFGEHFLSSILNADPRWSADSVSQYVYGFVSSYRNLYDSAEKIFNDFSPYEKEIKQGIRYVKHYYPAYKAPREIITYIGPLDGYGDILTEDALVVGLHQHLGSNFSQYKTTWVQETYPQYITNRFTPEYISVNCMKNIVLDMYPEKSEDKSLVYQMVEKGKRLYMLSRLLPETDEYKLIGYTQKQLKDCYEHETQIWDLFVQNNFLQTIDNNVIKNYIGEGPKTQELGESSPGNIGSFAGWQIVKQYMKKLPKTKLPDLMKTDAEIIFQEARYKP